MKGQATDRGDSGSVRVGARALWGQAAGVASLALLLGVAPPPARAADPLIVISVQSGGATTICDTNCTICTIMSGECISVDEEDLILCKPESVGLPITECDWSLFMQGDAPALQINTQLRAAEVAPNGNIVFVALTDTVVPGIGAVESDDMIVFNPDDPFKPFVGGGPYNDGTLKFYLNGDLSQSSGSAKPWDAVSILPDGSCEMAISATGADDHTCHIIGSLSGGTPGTGLDGVHANDEDLLRCIPSAFAANGVVEGCDFAMFFDSSKLNGGGVAGFTSEIKAIDFLSFNPATMSGELVFKKGSGNPTGFPAHDPGKDLLLYNGTFGAGLCVPSGNLCASIADCLISDTSCNTGSCIIGATPCASDDDCASGACATTRTPVGTVSKFFDGVAVGLTGSGQNIEAFSILDESDGDGVPDGSDNCPDDPNPPDTCSGSGPELCPSGLSSQCPMGETCQQADADGDGVGDACDQCNGRPDEGTCDACPFAPCPAPCGGSPTADCSCGDGILDLPSEQCDLGMSNGMGQCSTLCTVSGTCTGNMMPCTTAMDCPAGQGCCGNNIVESPEACDDGNAINNDTCKTDCTVNPLGTAIIGCEDLTGPNVIQASIKKTKFKDKPDFADFDRWKSTGSFIFAQGLTIDPDTQFVKIIYNNTPSGLLFQSQLDPGDCNPPFVQCFQQSGTVAKPKWKFLDKEADLAGAPSWRKGKFKIKSGNNTTFVLDGRNQTLFATSELGSVPYKLRQTIRIDDVCVTAVVQCIPNGNGKTLKCDLYTGP